MVSAIAFLATAAASTGPVHLDCTLGEDSGPPWADVRLEILFSQRRKAGPYSVSFVDPASRLADRYGSVTANERRWSVRLEQDSGRPVHFRLRSNRGRPDRGADLWAYSREGGRFEGRYTANQGMLSESFASGSSGPLACTIRYPSVQRSETAR